MAVGRGASAEWAGCEAGLRTLNGRLWEQQEALERGENGGGRAAGQAVRRAIESLPPSCLDAAQRSRLREDVTAWLAAVENGWGEEVEDEGGLEGMVGGGGGGSGRCFRERVAAVVAGAVAD